MAPEPGRPSSASPPKSDSPLLPQPLRDYMSQAWAARGTWRSVHAGPADPEAEGRRGQSLDDGAGRGSSRPPSQPPRAGDGPGALRGYHDGETGYGPGDLHVSAPEIVHQSIVDDDGPCLCLVMVEGGIRPTSLLGRVVAGLFGY